MFMSWVKAHKIKLVLIGISAVLALCALLFSVKTANTLEYEKAAEKWRGESSERFAYVSVFLPENEALTEEKIFSLKNGIETKLTEASFEAEEGKNLWNYACCTTAYVTASTERGSSSVNAVGIGGEFFFFHPMNLISGGYISENDLMHDRVVLTRELAWKLFGAIDVSGMTLYVDGREFIVAGVVDREKDFASEAAAAADSGLYMCHDMLYNITGTEIECFEAVLPNPVKNYSMEMLKELVPSENAVIIEASGRYTIGNALKVLGDFGKRSMRTDGIAYPSWENAARLTEDYFALGVLMTALFALPVVGFALFEAVKLGKSGVGKAKAFVDKTAVSVYDKVNDKLYEREQKAKINKDEEKDGS